jgi:Flp pilus assembly protein TadB
MAADELPQPVAAEFKLLYDQQNYGLPLPTRCTRSRNACR